MLRYTSILLLLLFTSCFNVQPLVVSEITDARITKFEKTDIEAQAKLRIKNPNNFQLKVLKSDVDLLVNNVMVGKARLSDDVIINSQSDEVYTFNVDTDVKKMLAGSLFGGGIGSLGGLMPDNKVDVTLRGNLRVKAKGFKKKLPIEITQKMPIPKQVPTQGK